MKITDDKYLDAYVQSIGNKIPTLLANFDFSLDSSFEYLTKCSAVYSSNIEGNSIDLNSFMNYEMNKDQFKGEKEIAEIEDLIEAYHYAQANPLNEENLLYCHKVFSDSFLIRSKRGTYREEPVGVFGKTGLVYMAVEPEFVNQEMTAFFQGVSDLLAKDLSAVEAFYYAAMVHLRFAHIHPFRDGNGRAARLIEKWFLAQALGRDFWKIPSEEYYKNHQAQYYQTIGLGVDYYQLNYEKCLPFLEMLPHSLTMD